jgi:hypothetical protein
LAVELERQQEDGSQPALFAGLALVPGQEPDSQIERACTSLFQAQSRRAIDLDQPSVKLLARGVGVNPARLQFFQEEFVNRLLTSPAKMRGRIPGIPVAQICRASEDSKRRTSGQHVFELRSTWT